MAVQFDSEKLVIDIREFMADHYMQSIHFANLSGVNVSTLSRLLTGKTRCVTSSNVAKIASAMGMPVEHYVVQQHRNYESMSIEELNDLLKTIRAVRDRKIEQKVTLYEGYISTYKKLLEEKE